MTVPPKEKPVSAFFPADNAAVIAHLNYLQAIITRLAGNSAQCKSWCLAIVSALFGFAGALKNDKIVACAIIPIVIFCLVDAAYLDDKYPERRDILRAKWRQSLAWEQPKEP